MGLDVFGHVVYGVKLEDPMLSIQCEHEIYKRYCWHCGQPEDDLSNVVYIQNYKPVYSHSYLQVFTQGYVGYDVECVVGKSVATWSSANKLYLLTDDERLKIDQELRKVLKDYYKQPDYYITVLINTQRG